MRYETIELSVADGIGQITLARPPVNAQNRTMRQEVIHAFDTCSEDEAVRVAMLQANGHVFSAGADIKERVGFTRQSGEYTSHNRLTRNFFDAIGDCEKPVICLAQGAAIGAGFAMMLHCDILLATEDAWFQMPEIDVGLAGGGKFMSRHFSRSWARYLYFTGRKIGAAELERLGVITACLPAEEASSFAREIAIEIAAKDAHATRMIKRGFQAVEDMPTRDAYRHEQTITFDLAERPETLARQKGFGRPS